MCSITLFFIFYSQFPLGSIYDAVMGVLTAKKPLVRSSLADRVYGRLLEDILSGTLASGTMLSVADISRDLEVSPSPVREAILRLAAEGLVINPTNRRATVIGFSGRDVAEIFQVRELLECGAARLAAERLDAAGLAEFKRAVEQCAALFGDPAQKKAMLDLDNRFHLLVAEASGNRALAEEIVRVSRRVRIMQWLRLDPARMNQGYADHMAVIAAFERRDPEAAADAMAAHIRAAGEFVREGLPPDLQ